MNNEQNESKSETPFEIIEEKPEPEKEEPKKEEQAKESSEETDPSKMDWDSKPKKENKFVEELKEHGINVLKKMGEAFSIIFNSTFLLTLTSLVCALLILSSTQVTALCWTIIIVSIRCIYITFLDRPDKLAEKIKNTIS